MHESPTRSSFRMMVASGVAVGSLLAALTTTAGADPAVGVAAGRAPGALVALRGSASPLEDASPLGPAPARMRLDLDVTLRVASFPLLQRYIAELSLRSSPLFHRFLRPGQFGPMFGPSLDEVRLVRSVLESEGLSVVSMARDRLALHVEGTVRAVERAFHTTLGRYRLPSGHVGVANSLPPEVPASIAGDVQGVVGLSDLYLPSALLARGGRAAHPRRAARDGVATGAAGPKPCAAAARVASFDGSYTAAGLASFYDMTPLYALGDLGMGARVAIAELEPNLAGDIATYQSCYGTHAVVEDHEVDGGAGTGAGVGEAALDIEDVIGLAPEATIDVYQGPNANAYDVYSAIVNEDVDKIVSNSWGLCDLDQVPAVMSAEQNLFAQAAAQGQSVFSAAGDAGSTDCYGDPGTSFGATPAVDDPASQPYVVGVGGTSIDGRAERVWNDSISDGGAGGGGISTWCMPAYQDQPGIPGLLDAESRTDSTCGAATPYAREVPDVSADADPSTGYVFYYSGTSGGPPGWSTIGGTSAAAPLWAAAAALIDSSPFCAAYGSGSPGVLPQGLYAVASSRASYIYRPGQREALYDVREGDNDYTPSGYTGGLYQAGAGYDMTSGLGTPVLAGLTQSGTPSNFYPGLAALMCSYYATRSRSASITSVSPRAGSTAGPTAVSIVGSGFLPIAGADRLQVGSQAVVPVCRSASLCTAVLPASPAGTVDLRMTVEDMVTSPATPADQFVFGTAPTVAVWSPTNSYQLGTRATVAYTASKASAGVPAVASYDVRYRVASYRSALPDRYVYPPAWQATTGTSESLAVLAGRDYCFGVRARGISGVVSAWSPDRCVTTPLGSRSLTPATTGWSRRSGAGYYHGSYIETTQAGAELRLAGALAGGVALVVTECPTCRAVAVYMNGRLLRTVGTYAPSTRHQVLIVVASFSQRRAATIVLRAVGRGRLLVIEGLGVR